MIKLYEVLREAGHEPVVLRDKVMALPFSGRVIGLYPDDKNLFWVNESLLSAETALKFFDNPGWINIGGDRAWISPEIETHIDDPKKYPESIKVPKKIDPGAYEVREADSNSVCLQSHMKVHFHQSGKIIPLNLARHIEVIETPPFPISGKVSFAGYRTFQKLSVTEKITGEMRPGIWSLIQVPGGGEIRIPVKEGVKPVSFFGTPVFTIKKNILTMVVRTVKSSKLSLKASHSKGILIYLHATGEKAVLVVRKFSDGDDSLYADYPSFNMADSGYCAEVYVDDGAYGGFGELEYHSKAINIGKGESETEDQSETWGFSGALGEINGICENIMKNI